MIDGQLVRDMLLEELKAAGEREAGGDMMVSIAAGSQKALLTRLLGYVEGLMDAREGGNE